jgi:hypothetical protein
MHNLISEAVDTMTQVLPPNLLALFAPRDPIPYLPPVDKLPHEKKITHNYQGIANYVHLFEDPVDTPAPVGVETREERRERRKREKAEQVAYKLEQEIALWDPNAIDSTMGDPFKTLFTARVNFYTSESKLRREFEQYGPVKSIKMVHNTKNGKPRGYAFIEYEHEKDMHCKYHTSDLGFIGHLVAVALILKIKLSFNKRLLLIDLKPPLPLGLDRLSVTDYIKYQTQLEYQTDTDYPKNTHICCTG